MDADWMVEGVMEMKVQELLYLKFQRRVSTLDLLRRYPREKRQIRELALLDVDEAALRQILGRRKTLRRLARLRRRLAHLGGFRVKEPVLVTCRTLTVTKAAGISH